MFPKVLEQLVNGYLQLDPDGCEQFSTLIGKVIAIEIAGLSPYYIFPENRGLRFETTYTLKADVTISGSSLALLRLLQSDGYPLPPGVQISGDLDVAHAFQTKMKEIDIDWEEQLSYFTGDVIAHSVGNTVRSIIHWGKEAISSVRQTSTEYIQEEIRYLPPRQEIRDFMQDVDISRNDVERLEARIKRLEKKKA